MYNFLLGFATAILTTMVISCAIEPLEAINSEVCGDQEWRPCYVRIVE